MTQSWVDNTLTLWSLFYTRNHCSYLMIDCQKRDFEPVRVYDRHEFEGTRSPRAEGSIGQSARSVSVELLLIEYESPHI